MKKIISIILILSIIASITLTNVYAGDSVRGIFNKQQDIINYGIELMDMEKSKAFEIYMALLGITTDTTELKIFFDTPIILEAESQEEINTVDKDKLSLVDNDAQIAMDAFKADYPEIFWYDIVASKCNAIIAVTNNSDGSQSFAIKGLKITFSVYSEYADDIEGTYDNVLNKLNEIVDATKGMDRYNKLKYFHDYLINTIEYDMETTDAFNMHGALINNKATCEGYSESFKALCDLANIPCVIVRGKSLNTDGKETNHMWNYCLMEDDKWYAVDVTWDDIGYPCYDFFLVGSKTVVMINDRTFAHTHRPIGDFSFTEVHEFTYPQLNETAYEVVEFMFGDLNSDMIINGSDALAVLKISARLIKGSASEIKAADVDGNGIINSEDALNILKYAARIIKKFPVEM